MILLKVSKNIMDKSVKSTIEKLNAECINYLPNKDKDILTILEYILEVNETGILSNLDLELNEEQYDRLLNTITRVKNNEPLEYITNTSYFYGLRFKVTKDTLIPRPETEVLVDLALSEINERIYTPDCDGKEISIIDIGTGTGCIPISLSLSNKGNIKITAVDISQKALDIANENIKESGQSEQITTHLSDLFDRIPKNKRFDFILANLPYISTQKMQFLPKSVKNFEPSIAIDGGKGGTEIIFRLLDQSKGRLKKGGIIILEVDPNQIKNILTVVIKEFSKGSTTIAKDFSDKERFLVIRN